MREFKMLHVMVDAQTLARLRVVAAETFDQRAAGDAELDRQLEELAENAVAEAALNAFRNRADDPGRGSAG